MHTCVKKFTSVGEFFCVLFGCSHPCVAVCILLVTPNSVSVAGSDVNATLMLVSLNFSTTQSEMLSEMHALLA